MSLKAPLHPEHMVPNSAEFYIAKKWSDPLLQVGFYKNQSFASAGETTEDVYSNGVIKKTKDGKKATVSFDVHELTVEKLAILQSGLVELQPGTVSGEVEVFMPGDWSFDKDVLLKFGNADGTAVSVSSVSALIDGVATSLVASTDYTLGVTSFGATYVKFLTGETGGKLTSDAPETVKITITYSATNSTGKVLDHKDNSLASPFVMVVVNEYEYEGNKKTIKTYLDNCLADKSMLQQIADSDNTTVGFPITITGNIVSQEFVGFSMSTTTNS